MGLAVTRMDAVAGGKGPAAALQPNADLSSLLVKEGMELRLTQLPYGQVYGCVVSCRSEVRRRGRSTLLEWKERAPS